MVHWVSQTFKMETGEKLKIIDATCCPLKYLYPSDMKDGEKEEFDTFLVDIFINNDHDRDLPECARNAYLVIGFYYRFQKNHDQALVYFQKAEALGNSQAMVEIGDYHIFGCGVAKDYDQAWVYYKKAEALGNVDALVKIGHCYWFGRGITTDYYQAFTYYKKAGAFGNALAFVSIGNCFSNGHGVAKDYDRALVYYRKAEALGNVDALVKIGICYCNGSGVEKDYAQSFAYYKKAEALGNVQARILIGHCYLLGLGVAKDRFKAFKCLCTTNHNDTFTQDERCMFKYMMKMEQNMMKMEQDIKSQLDMINALKLELALSPPVEGGSMYHQARANFNSVSGHDEDSDGPLD